MARVRRRTEVGFAIAPQLVAEIEQLDRMIRQLGADIGASKSPRVNAAFRNAYAAYVDRWQTNVRGPASDWQARLLSVTLEAKLTDFRAALARWRADYTARKLPADPLTTAEGQPMENPDIVPDELENALGWGIAAAALIGAVALWKLGD